jgi:deferrochelatase/peroxidase EfeB
MAVALDLADIQGNILGAYGKQGFPKGRYITLHIDNPAEGRKFVTALLPKVTTALRWPSRRAPVRDGAVTVPRPDVAVNIAFSWYGLVALGIPTRTLRGMPDEFIDGMMGRAPMLGDNFNNRDPMQEWDNVWRVEKAARDTNPSTVHILITLNARMDPDGKAVKALDAKTAEINALCKPAPNGVRVLPGHGRGQQAPYQELSAITYRQQNGTFAPLPREHFGFIDALGDPVFEGQFQDRDEESFEVGNGAVDGNGKWRPLATGEFLLGYPDEAQEIAGAAMPLDFSRNGTFMAYRKLHQNVDGFRKFMTETGKSFGAVIGINNPKDAENTLMAKIAGRWPDGVPLALAPTIAAWDEFNRKYPDVSPDVDLGRYTARQLAMIDFTYKADPDGLKCPIASHMRRVNTRDGMAPTGTEGSALNNRRRILRRGLPYGDSPEGVSDTDEHGIVMLVVCANLFRQFEFVQQQWINYGLDANSGNDTCPLTGNHSPGGDAGPKAKYVIPSDPKSGRPPFIVEGIPQFVETRGGEYFFVPSMTALRMIGMGVVDPT